MWSKRWSFNIITRRNRVSWSQINKYSDFYSLQFNSCKTCFVIFCNKVWNLGRKIDYSEKFLMPWARFDSPLAPFSGLLKIFIFCTAVICFDFVGGFVVPPHSPPTPRNAFCLSVIILIFNGGRHKYQGNWNISSSFVIISKFLVSPVYLWIIRMSTLFFTRGHILFKSYSVSFHWTEMKAGASSHLR